MAVAQELGRATKAAHEKIVKESIEHFVAACRGRAAQGLCSCKASFEMPKCYTELLPLLRQSMNEMGFERVSVGGEHFDHGMKYEIFAEWKVEPASKKSGEGVEGTSSICPVCLENRPVVALTPCGHVVCQKCQGSHQFRQCPTCRAHVTGATRALFL